MNDIDHTTILIIDQDESNILLLEEMLGVVFSESDNYQILTTHYGQEALELCKKQNIILVFADIRLRDADGLELLRKIKLIDSNIYTILQTATVTDDMLTRIQDSCCDDYLIKPIDLHDLDHKVRYKHFMIG